MEYKKLKATLQADYYGKAHVGYENGIHYLKSYDTIVCTIDDNGTFTRLWSGYSRTTMTHVNDFRKAHNLPMLNAKGWRSIPCENKETYKVTGSNGFVNHTLSATFGSYEEAQTVADRMSNGHVYYWVD